MFKENLPHRTACIHSVSLFLLLLLRKKPDAPNLHPGTSTRLLFISFFIFWIEPKFVSLKTLLRQALSRNWRLHFCGIILPLIGDSVFYFSSPAVSKYCKNYYTYLKYNVKGADHLLLWRHLRSLLATVEAFNWSKQKLKFKLLF